MASWGTHTSELELVSRLYMYCNIVKLGVYVYHTRDMWMGPNRRCETGFWYFLWHILFFPPSHFFVQYILLRYRPSTIVASDGKTDLCTVDIISCYDAEACPGRKINKSAGTDTKQFNMASWCDTCYWNTLISQFECYLTHDIR